jgi:hypothetical protein
MATAAVLESALAKWPIFGPIRCASLNESFLADTQSMFNQNLKRSLPIDDPGNGSVETVLTCALQGNAVMEEPRAFIQTCLSRLEAMPIDYKVVFCRNNPTIVEQLKFVCQHHKLQCPIDVIPAAVTRCARLAVENVLKRVRKAAKRKRRKSVVVELEEEEVEEEAVQTIPEPAQAPVENESTESSEVGVLEIQDNSKLECVICLEAIIGNRRAVLLCCGNGRAGHVKCLDSLTNCPLCYAAKSEGFHVIECVF